MLLAAVLFTGLAGAPAAQAHDELTGSTPADGAVLAEAPDRVELTFSNNPAAIGSQVRVTGPDGTEWADGDVEVLNNVATQRLRTGMPDGEYTVQWRVVSSDAHPIEGGFGFTVGSGATSGPGATALPSAPGEGTADGGVAEDGGEGSVAEDGVAEEDPGAGPGVWILGMIGVVVAAGLVVVALLVRSRVRGPGGS